MINQQRVRYRKFGDNAIELEAMGTISKPGDREKIIHKPIKDISKTLTKEGVDIPFPQLYVHLDKG